MIKIDPDIDVLTAVENEQDQLRGEGGDFMTYNLRCKYKQRWAGGLAEDQTQSHE